MTKSHDSGDQTGSGKNRRRAAVLTAAGVRQARPCDTRQEVPDAALPGLYLVIQPSGAKSFALRYRRDGKPAKLTLGKAIEIRAAALSAVPAIGEPMTLGEAREAARRALRLIGEGGDPAAAKAAHKAAPAPERDLVKHQSADFIRRYAQPRLRSWAELQRQFDKEINPVIGGKKIQDVTKRDLIDLVEAIVDRGAPISANRVLATLSRFFGWLAERDIIAASPAFGMKKPGKETARERVLADDELALVWQAAGRLGYPFGPAIRLLILTGCRRDEAFAARWTEIAFGNVLEWILPAARVKNGRDHVIPVTREIRELLDGLPHIGPGDFVFTTAGHSPASGYARAKQRIDREIAGSRGDGPLPHWTFHDLRRTTASGMARLGVDIHVIEAVLNHKSGRISGVAGVYNRFDYAAEKRAALEAWARHVITLADRAA